MSAGCGRDILSMGGPWYLTGRLKIVEMRENKCLRRLIRASGARFSGYIGTAIRQNVSIRGILMKFCHVSRNRVDGGAEGGGKHAMGTVGAEIRS